MATERWSMIDPSELRPFHIGSVCWGTDRPSPGNGRPRRVAESASERGQGADGEWYTRSASLVWLHFHDANAAVHVWDDAPSSLQKTEKRISGDGTFHSRSEFDVDRARSTCIQKPAQKALTRGVLLEKFATTSLRMHARHSNSLGQASAQATVSTHLTTPYRLVDPLRTTLSHGGSSVLRSAFFRAPTQYQAPEERTSHHW